MLNSDFFLVPLSILGVEVIQPQGPDQFPEFPGILELWLLVKKIILKIPEISRQAVNMRTDVELSPLKFTLKQSTEYAKKGKEIFIDTSEQRRVSSTCLELGEFFRGNVHGTQCSQYIAAFVKMLKYIYID